MCVSVCVCVCVCECVCVCVCATQSNPMQTFNCEEVTPSVTSAMM